MATLTAAKGQSMNIQQLSERYKAFLQQTGNLDETDWSQEIEALFLDNFSKIANGVVLVSHRSQLQDQMLRFRAFSGAWKIEGWKMIPSADAQYCIIDYVFTTEHAGNFRVMEILTVSDGMRIGIVDEVYYKEDKDMAIERLGERYNELQQAMGDPLQSDWSQEIADLFSEGFTKAINGRTIVKNRAELQERIIECREDSGAWTIMAQPVIPSRDGTQCVAPYFLASEKRGKFEVMALIVSADGKHIDSISEIYYQIEE